MILNGSTRTNMNNKNTVKEGKVIAKFMDIFVEDFCWREHHTLAIGDETGYVDLMECDFYTPSSNWNQLMEVVAKIEKLGYGFTIDPWTVDIIEYISGKEERILHYQKESEEKLIDHYYYPVLYFIEWYNEQFQK